MVWPPVTMRCTPERVEDPPDAVAGGHGHDGGLDGDVELGGVLVGNGLTDPALLFDLVEQVGDPDVAGTPAVDGRLDGRADVVGVDVAVPQPVAADDDDRVADPGPHVLEGGDRLVGRLEEVHDLVAQVGHAPRAVGVAGRGVGRHHRGRQVAVELAPTDLGLGHRTAVDHREGRVDEQEQARAAGVDHARLGQHGQQLGRAGQRVGPGGASAVEHAHQRVTPLGGGGGTRRRLADHREDGALDRTHHRAVGRVAGGDQGGGHGPHRRRSRTGGGGR